jgi:alkanesulfonate monooxygenase SsuD/methylene tetrahydromethanopterin reductase-like flavin-dependent oxidoreductase (luciferase family)
MGAAASRRALWRALTGVNDLRAHAGTAWTAHARNKTLAHDSLGVRWGLAGGTTLATVEEVREAARVADASGFDGLWVSQGMAVDPSVALAWDRPFSLTRDFVNGLQPLLVGQAAHVVGEQVTTRATLDINAPPPPSSWPPLAPACCDVPENASKAPRWAHGGRNDRPLCVAALGRRGRSRRS